ncbi:hypothetical protein Ptr902_02313 [Pyrenophora tritici-repentis]|nr:hypothetical protein Ptr902_02313 [Pyrenophora tritici-repentis]
MVGASSPTRATASNAQTVSTSNVAETSSIRANCACSTISEERVERTPTTTGHRSTATLIRDLHGMSMDLTGVGEQFNKDT